MGTYKMNYKIIISTLVRDDEDYLDEWLDYHRDIGVDHFVIYDHKSRRPVLPRKDVTVYRVDRTDPHNPDVLHNMTLEEVKSEWISLLDVDEFIGLSKHRDLHSLLKDYRNYGGLVISYLIYGSNGHKTRPEGKVKDNYLMRTPGTYFCNRSAKCILKCSAVKKIINQHGGYTTLPVVNEKHERWVINQNGKNTHDICRLNHYYTRSFEEWKRKVDMGNRERWQVPRNINFIHEIDKNCTIYDPLLYDWDIHTRGTG